MNEFKKMLDQMIGDQENPKQRHLADLEAEMKARQGEIEELAKKIEEKKAASNDNWKKIVVRYNDSVEPAAVEILEGIKPEKHDQPENAVALLEATAKIMAAEYGMNEHMIASKLLDCLADCVMMSIFDKIAKGIDE